MQAMKHGAAVGVSVIIATMASAQRKQSLFRAIDSVRNQLEVEVELIVVVNGSYADPEVLKQLMAASDLKVIRQEEGNLPRALRNGREQISKPCFAFLDDDDEYLPDTLAHRVNLLMDRPDADLIISNGYYIDLSGSRSVYLSQFEEAKSDPLGSLARFNWLASCGGIYRTATIAKDYFDGKTQYFEWTYLSLKIALDKKIYFDDVPAYLIHQSPTSLSQSDAYLQAEVEFLRHVVQMPLPDELRRAMRIKLGRACHNRSDYLRSKGERSAALKFHLLSLKEPGGWQYLSYSRRILL